MSKFYVSAACGIGLKRRNNEDNLCINNVYLNNEEIEETENTVYKFEDTCNEPLFVAVCDGMGGEIAGERASQLAVSRLANMSYAADENAVFSGLRSINTELLDEAKKLGALRIGCTAAILSIDTGTAMAINIGDSRVYRLRNRKLERLTHDQSEVQSYIDVGILSEKEARKHPLRHMVRQFLGMPDDMLVFEDAKKSDVKSEDVFLVCSDGLTECLEDKEICKILRTGASAKDMYDAAMKKGGVDNTTVIIVKVE